MCTNVVCINQNIYTHKRIHTIVTRQLRTRKPNRSAAAWENAPLHKPPTPPTILPATLKASSASPSMKHSPIQPVG